MFYNFAERERLHFGGERGHNMVVPEKNDVRAAVQRALSALAKLEPSKASFARRCNSTSQNVAHWLSGQNMPPVDKLVEIADAYGASLDVMTGRCEADAAPDALMPDERELLASFRSMDDDARLVLMTLARRMRG